MPQVQTIKLTQRYTHNDDAHCAFSQKGIQITEMCFICIHMFKIVPKVVITDSEYIFFNFFLSEMNFISDGY